MSPLFAEHDLFSFEIDNPLKLAKILWTNSYFINIIFYCSPLLAHWLVYNGIRQVSKMG